MDYVDDEEITNLKAFYKAKVSRWNSITERFGFPYRFEWQYSMWETDNAFRAAMESVTPSSQSCCEDNIINICGHSGFNTNLHGFLFCTATSDFQKYWPVIQFMHDWTLRYNIQQPYNLDNVEYWNRVLSLTDIVRTSIEHSAQSDIDSQRLLKQIQPLAQKASWDYEHPIPGLERSDTQYIVFPPYIYIYSRVMAVFRRITHRPLKFTSVKRQPPKIGNSPRVPIPSGRLSGFVVRYC